MSDSCHFAFLLCFYYYKIKICQNFFCIKKMFMVVVCMTFINLASLMGSLCPGYFLVSGAAM